MLEYAGGAICPRCQTSLVHEYECAGDCLPLAAITHADQRLLCPRCGYTRSVAYVIARRPAPSSLRAQGARQE